MRTDKSISLKGQDRKSSKSRTSERNASRDLSQPAQKSPSTDAPGEPLRRKCKSSDTDSFDEGRSRINFENGWLSRCTARERRMEMLSEGTHSCNRFGSL